MLFCDFPNFCLIDVFSLEMDSQVYEDNFQLFPDSKEANLGKENDMVKKWYIENLRSQPSLVV